MAIQKGRDVTIAVGDAASPEVFTDLGALRNASITFDGGSAPDVTSADDTTRQRQLLAGAAVRSLNVSGSGVFDDSTALNTAEAHIRANTFPNLQITIPDYGTYTGAFHITSLEYAGDHDGEATYNIAVASAGDITYASV